MNKMETVQDLPKAVGLEYGPEFSLDGFGKDGSEKFGRWLHQHTKAFRMDDTYSYIILNGDEEEVIRCCRKTQRYALSRDVNRDIRHQIKSLLGLI